MRAEAAVAREDQAALAVGGAGGVLMIQVVAPPEAADAAAGRAAAAPVRPPCAANSGLSILSGLEGRAGRTEQKMTEGKGEGAGAQ